MSEAARLDGLVSFFSSHHALRGEAVLTRRGFVVRLVPGPKDLSPNCGVALRFEYARRDEVVLLLTRHKVRVDRVHYYRPRTDAWSPSQQRGG